MSNQKLMLTGSINYTELKKLVKDNEMTAHENGNIYVPITAFLNDIPDKYGNHLTLTAKNEKTEKWAYFANLKKR